MQYRKKGGGVSACDMGKVESDEKDKKQVTIFMLSMYNMNQRKMDRQADFNKIRKYV
jgi:hypothetical protein